MKHYRSRIGKVDDLRVENDIDLPTAMKLDVLHQMKFDLDHGIDTRTVVTNLLQLFIEEIQK